MFARLKERLYLDSHHQMERFAVEMFVLSVALIFLFGVCIYAKHTANDTMFAERAIYTPRFEMSRSGVTGGVKNVYRSDDGKSAMLLLKLDDITKVSTDANKWEVYLTVADIEGNPKKMSVLPSGTIFSFGSTGYMGVYLYSEAGFGPEVLRIILRSTSELTQMDKDPDSIDYYKKYDQTRIVFNPSAKAAVVSDILGKQDFKPSELYASFVSNEEERAVKESMTTALNNLYIAQEKIKDASLAVSTPVIREVDGQQVRVMVPDFMYYSDDELVKDGNTIAYTCGTPLPGGVDIDWQNTTLATGYCDQILGDMMLDEYIKQRDAIIKDKPFRKYTVSDFMLSDGSSWLDYTGKKTNPIIVDIDARIAELLAAYSEYLNCKSQLQISNIQKLMEIELKAESVDYNYTVNRSEKAVVSY